MRSFLTIIPLLGLLLLYDMTQSLGQTNPDFSKFGYIDFQQFRLTSPDTSYGMDIKTMIIRREGFKRGTMGLIFDSTLKEAIPICSPVTPDTICPRYYQYFLVDSIWFVGNNNDKFAHRIELQSVFLFDTTILDAWTPKNHNMVSEPSIPQLDRLIDKPMYANITITKRKYRSPISQKYSIQVYGDLHQFWLRKDSNFH